MERELARAAVRQLYAAHTALSDAAMCLHASGRYTEEIGSLHSAIVAEMGHVGLLTAKHLAYGRERFGPSFWAASPSEGK